MHSHFRDSDRSRMSAAFPNLARFSINPKQAGGPGHTQEPGCMRRIERYRAAISHRMLQEPEFEHPWTGRSRPRETRDLSAIFDLGNPYMDCSAEKGGPGF